MKKGLIVICFFQLASHPMFGRETRNLNFGWRFECGDVTDAAMPEFDDSGWHNVNLPHDFQISQPWVAPANTTRVTM